MRSYRGATAACTARTDESAMPDRAWSASARIGARGIDGTDTGSGDNGASMSSGRGRLARRSAGGGRNTDEKQENAEVGIREAVGEQQPQARNDTCSGARAANMTKGGEGTRRKEVEERDPGSAVSLFVVGTPAPRALYSCFEVASKKNSFASGGVRTHACCHTRTPATFKPRKTQVLSRAPWTTRARLRTIIDGEIEGFCLDIPTVHSVSHEFRTPSG